MRAKLAFLDSVFFFASVFSAVCQLTFTADAAAAPPSNAPSSTNSVSKNDDSNSLNEFQQWAETYAPAGPSDKANLAANGLSLAKQRRGVLAALIESDPQEALRQALPTRLRAELPAEIVAQLEERVS